MAVADLSSKGKLDPIALLDARHQSANLLNASTELFTKAMGDIVARQVDFLRVESDEMAKCAAALAGGGEPAELLQHLTNALHSGADDALTDFRAIQDLMRGCMWGLVGLYVESLSVAVGNGRLVPIPDAA